MGGAAQPHETDVVGCIGGALPALAKPWIPACQACARSCGTHSAAAAAALQAWETRPHCCRRAAAWPEVGAVLAAKVHVCQACNLPVTGCLTPMTKFHHHHAAARKMWSRSARRRPASRPSLQPRPSRQGQSATLRCRCTSKGCIAVPVLDLQLCQALLLTFVAPHKCSLAFACRRQD